MESRQPPHILLVAYPLQSHMNPALQFANYFLNSGAHVTLVTTVSGVKRMKKSGGAAPTGLSFATISDGYDDGFTSAISDESALDGYMLNFKRRGSETLSDLIAAGTAVPPYTCVVYTILLPWVANVARRHNLPSALLWLQNAALLSIYYHYFNGYGDIIHQCDENDPQWCLNLPSLPPLHARDLPSFLTPSNTYTFAEVSLKEQFEVLGESQNPIILVNTFDSLEHEIIESLQTRFKVLAVGPLLPREKSSGFAVDLFSRPEEDYVAWMDAQPNNSVVYVSFGSISAFSREQKEEIAAALLECRRPFLWVMRKDSDENKDDETVTSRWVELEKLGMIVSWCSQLEVLSHRATGCFVTHCGWNSTLESLSTGVPVVAVPQWTDQPTNAKMLESMWGTGVRVADKKVVSRNELTRCVETVMESEKVRADAMRWRELAIEAIKDGGSSDSNIRVFVDEVWKMSKTRFNAGQEEL
uniref:Glycosyltransferase n=1 Tax=Fagopyrum esculentum TaxID=3617 RepID=A0A0A1HA07_FAGES|nr:UDP-glycose: glycosyltransferase UGT75R1 [Fagopyrum esculentum]